MVLPTLKYSYNFGGNLYHQKLTGCGLPPHYSYKMSILRPLPAKSEHLNLFDPCRAKKLTFDLFFDNYETVRRR